MLIKAKRFLIKSSEKNEFSWLENHVMHVNSQGFIEDFIPSEKVTSKIDIEYINYDILPGLIDLHTHGCVGVDTMDASTQSLTKMAHFLASKGVVAFQPTTVTNTLEKIHQTLATIKQAMQQQSSGAKILGAYMEGPYFTAQHRGAHPIHLLRDLDLVEIKELVSEFKGVLNTFTLAPEKDNAIEVIQYLKSEGLTVMLGHSNANYQETTDAFNAGADGLVHCYNGMSGLHHREPGMLGAGLSNQNAFLEIICDGFHVAPAAIEIAARCSNQQQRMFLITDAMEATGMPDGEYRLGEYTVTMKEGVVKTPDGSLAGSTLTLDQAVFNTAKWLNISLEKSWYMASFVPASFMKIDNLGSLEVGKTASFVVLLHENQENLVSKDIKAKKIVSTWIEGKEFYNQKTN